MALNQAEQSTFYLRSIQETREKLDHFRKSGKGFTSEYLRCHKSFLARMFGGDKRFNQFYVDQMKLYQHGKVVWGQIVQANQLLFEPDNDCDCPAVFIYSLEEEFDLKPYQLEQFARSLFDIKGADTDPDLAEFSRKLEDEMEADWKLPIPLRITDGVQCYYTVNMVFLKHLPNGYLANGLFPFLVAPDHTDVGFILPSMFWSENFIDAEWG